ncbi:MAG: type III-A CRISPR-associated protein Cas10/Csm1, partial [Promethearchaeota archaeon]
MCFKISKKNQLNSKDFIIAGLLHDIGKFYQRMNQSQYGRQAHEKIGAQVLESLKYPNNIRKSIRIHHGKDEQLLKQMTKSELLLSNIIKRADWLSSSERKDSAVKDFDPKRPLKSVFSIIASTQKAKIKDSQEIFNKKLIYSAYQQLYRENNKEFPFIYPHEETENLPKKLRISDSDSEIILKDLEDFIKPYGEKINPNPNYLLRIIENYFFFLPARSMEVSSDISLADHSKTTAAIAHSIINYLKFKYANIEKEQIKDINNLEIDLESSDIYSNINKILSNYKEIPFRLIKIDISGIQNFINLTPEAKALRIMRAKSMFLDFILQDISSYVLDQFNLSRSNLIYCSGGNAYILTYERPDFDQIIDHVQNELYLYAFNKLEMQLKIFIDSVPIKGNHFSSKTEENEAKEERTTDKKLDDKMKETIAEKMHEVSLKINTKKNKPFLSILSNPDFENKLINAPKNCYQEGWIKCAICGKYIPDTKENAFELNPGEPEKICKNCMSIKKISDLLIQERYTLSLEERGKGDNTNNNTSSQRYRIIKNKFENYTIIIRINKNLQDIERKELENELQVIEFPFAYWLFLKIGHSLNSEQTNQFINQNLESLKIPPKRIDSIFLLNNYNFDMMKN